MECLTLTIEKRILLVEKIQESLLFKQKSNFYNPNKRWQWRLHHSTRLTVRHYISIECVAKYIEVAQARLKSPVSG